MSERIPRIASKPITVVWPDLGNLHANLSESSSTRLAGIEGSLRSLLDATHISNSGIREIAQERTRYYRDRVTGNFAQVQSFLGFPRPTAAIGAPDEPQQVTGEAYTPIQTPVFTLFYEAFASESRAMGVDPTTIDGGTQAIGRMSDTFATHMYQTLADGFGRFTRLVNNFGNPEVLRAEASDAGRRRLDTLAERLTRLGNRPEEDSFGKRFGRRLTGSIEMGREQFDGLVEQRIDRFGDPTVSDLLGEYVQTAMLHYMRQAFGETDLVLSRGHESDPPEFFDFFQQRQGTPLTRPLFPSEVLRDALRREINTMLYGDSPISKFFDTQGNKFQKSGRDARKTEASFMRRSQQDTTFDPFTNSVNDTGAEQVNIFPGLAAAQIDSLDEHYRDVWVTFDRFLAALPLDDADPIRQKIKKDFMNRLSRAQDSRKQVGLNKLLRGAVAALSPDRQEASEEEIELFKHYVWMRDEMNPKSTGEYLNVDF